jgi:hypothetical protein
MQKEKSIFHLLVTALFIGILLSFALFYLICTVYEHDHDIAPSCLDGSVIEGEDFTARFERAVYQNKRSLSRIREYNYLFFHTVNDPGVIAGLDSFLFEIQNPENEYHYFDDYLGECAFDEKELSAILALLQHRKQSYAERGSEYLLVVLPNAQTVYSENMPAYMGEIEQTRLDRLDAYLRTNGFDSFLNMTDTLLENKSKGLLYNNTENSLNSMGLYYTYRAVCEYLGEHFAIHAPVPTHYDFYTHRTAGKSLSQQVGLGDTIPNLTVSLANAGIRGYDTVYQSRYASKTVLNEQDHPLGALETPSLLLQFPTSWERLQSEPFFSNVFSAVTYQTNWYDDPEVFAEASPGVTVQFIYEYQLSALLSRDYYS